MNNQSIVVSCGEAREPGKSLFPRSVITTVRYADPVAWMIAGAVHGAVDPIREQIERVSERVGIIGICEKGPVEATAAIRQAAIEGFPSPMRYPAANPGSLVGVSCIAFQFRGPTLCLLVSPGEGVRTAMIAAGQWLAREAAEYVVVVVGGEKGARAVIVGRQGESRMAVPAVVEWLAGPKES